MHRVFLELVLGVQLDFGLSDGDSRSARGEAVLLGGGREECSGSVRMLDSGVENELRCGVRGDWLSVSVSV